MLKITKRRRPVTAWTSYTPTATNAPTSTTFSNCFYRRLGEELQFKGQVAFGSADGAASQFYISPIPAGFTYNSSLRGGAVLGAVAGYAKYFRNAAGHYVGIMTDGNSGLVAFQFSFSANAFLGSTLQNLDAVYFSGSLPIVTPVD